jgi:CrcB protein
MQTPSLSNLTLVCLAGGMGTAARYLIALWTVGRFGPEFPWGTLAVNVMGCFAISIAVHIAAAAGWSPEVRSIVTVGFLGGFTTYSSFNLDTITLVERAPAQAVGYLCATLVGGLAAGWLGFAAGRQLMG